MRISLLRLSLSSVIVLLSLEIRAQQGAIQSFKGDQNLPYHDLYLFPYKGQKIDALWLLAPPYLETIGDLNHSLFNLHRRGMSSEVLRSEPFPQVELDPNRNRYQKVMDLQIAATSGLRALVEQRAEYGAALAQGLKAHNSKTNQLPDLQQKARRMTLSFAPYQKASAPLPAVPSGLKIYTDITTVDASRDLVIAQKVNALDGLMKASIQSRNAEEYAFSVTRILALQDLSVEAKVKAAKIIQGYHVDGILKGFPVDRLISRLFSAEFIKGRSGFDLIGLNKIILRADMRRDQERIVVLLLLARSAFSLESTDPLLLTDELYERMMREEDVTSLVQELTALGTFGTSEVEVREEISRALQIWKGVIP